MNASALLIAALLAQTEPAPAADPAPAAEPAAAPPPTAQPIPGAPRTGGGLGSKAVSPAEVKLQLERIKKLAPEEGRAEAKKMANEFGGMAGVNLPVEAPDTPLIDSEGFAALPEIEQVRLMSRVFSQHIITGDARSLVLLSSFPFQLEDRNLASPEELHAEWLRSLRSKRTDALTLYGVEVLTPAEMEKKYGRAPPRLGRVPLSAPKTFVAISNLSGHASIVVWRYISAQWQAVAYTD